MPSVDPPFDIAEVSPDAFPHAVTGLRVLETHISWVVLTGEYAYKIKKPVRYDFLDASTLERRQVLCNEELRLNRRLAPDLYIDVIAITREAGQLRAAGAGRAVEYAIRMHQFDPDQELANQLRSGVVLVGEMTALASAIATLHRHAAVASADSPFGDIASVRGQTLDNMTVLGQHADASQDTATIRRLDAWLRHTLAHSALLVSERKRAGLVRECHGDLHARNIVRWRNRWTPFDCIEFNPDLRWIDVMSDVAFLFMDLAAHGRNDLAHAFLSRHLEETGDYQGLRLLPLYAVYRALVRAKIDALGAKAVSPEAAGELRAREAQRVRVAGELASARQPALLITHGLTASGKSWLTERLVPAIDAVRIRADLERKRLAGLEPLEQSHSGVGEKLYEKGMTDRVYARLRECADAALAGGFTAIVDASFLKSHQRELFRQLARARHCPLVILWSRADPKTLRARVDARARAGRDASEANRAVLEHQLATQEPLTGREQGKAVAIDTDRLDDAEIAIGMIRSRLPKPKVR